MVEGVHVAEFSTTKKLTGLGNEVGPLDSHVASGNQIAGFEIEMNKLQPKESRADGDKEKGEIRKNFYDLQSFTPSQFSQSYINSNIFSRYFYGYVLDTISSVNDQDGKFEIKDIMDGNLYGK